MTRAFGIVVALALAFGSAGNVEAKSLSRIVASVGLAPEDFNILSETARKLYDIPNPQPGKIATWTNPDSGSHGRVRLAAVRKNCVFIQHFVYPKGDTTATELRTQICKSADGRWLLHP